MGAYMNIAHTYMLTPICFPPIADAVLESLLWAHAYLKPSTIVGQLSYVEETDKSHKLVTRTHSTEEVLRLHMHWHVRIRRNASEEE